MCLATYVEININVLRSNEGCCDSSIFSIKFTMDLSTSICVLVIISINNVRSDFCAPSVRYVSKTALVSNNLRSLNFVSKPHIESCVEYCFDHAFGNIIHLDMSSQRCYCFNTSARLSSYFEKSR